MDIWYNCPSANPHAPECLSQWKKLGYKLFILGEDDYGLADKFIYCTNAEFKGCVWANNVLIDQCMHDGADLIWVGSDDYYPDARYSAEQVAEIYTSVFPQLDGVMESGDGKEQFERTLAIAPLIGRKYFTTHRPTWPEGYHHFCADREIVITAGEKFFNEQRLRFGHRHWSKNSYAQPKHMSRWEALYSEDKAVFKSRFHAIQL